MAGTIEEFMSKKDVKDIGLNEGYIEDILPIQKDLIWHDFKHGEKTTESCHVNGLDDIFSWMRGFQYCWFGIANHGKSEVAKYLTIVKSMMDGWKWLFWEPEGMTSDFVKGKEKPIIHYNNFAKKIMWTYIGYKCPFKTVAKKHGYDFFTKEDFKKGIDFVEKHFITMKPKHRDIDYIMDVSKKIYDTERFDGVFIDPFKNLLKTKEQAYMRDDLFLDNIFIETKEFAAETNTVFNWVAHAKSDKTGPRTKKMGKNDYIKDGLGRNVAEPGDLFIQAPEQENILGGIAWENNMDVIMRVHRPFKEMDRISQWEKFSTIWLKNCKQKDQELTNGVGNYYHVGYNPKTKRYLFDGHDVLNRNTIQRGVPF